MEINPDKGLTRQQLEHFLTLCNKYVFVPGHELNVEEVVNNWFKGNVIDKRCRIIVFLRPAQRCAFGWISGMVTDYFKEQYEGEKLTATNVRKIATEITFGRFDNGHKRYSVAKNWRKKNG